MGLFAFQTIRKSLDMHENVVKNNRYPCPGEGGRKGKNSGKNGKKMLIST